MPFELKKPAEKKKYFPGGPITDQEYRRVRKLYEEYRDKLHTACDILKARGIGDGRVPLPDNYSKDDIRNFFIYYVNYHKKKQDVTESSRSSRKKTKKSRI